MALSTEALSQVLHELKVVTGPHKLGIYLGIEPARVAILLKDASDTDRQKSDVVQWWLENDENASWSTLTKTLKKIGHKRLARELTAKYIGEERDSEEDEIQGRRAEIQKSEKDAKIEYGQFLFHASKLMEDKCVYLPDIKVTWSGYDSEMSHEACEAKDIKTFLMAIRENQGPYAYENISGLLRLFCNHEGEELVAEYERKLKDKLLKRVSPVKRMGKRFKVKVDKEMSRENIMDFRNTLAMLFDCEAKEFILGDIHEGCIELTYVIPAELAEYIQKCEKSCHKQFTGFCISELWIEGQLQWKHQFTSQSVCDVESAGQQYSHSHRCLFVFTFLLLTAAVVVVVVGYITEYKFTMEGAGVHFHTRVPNEGSGYIFVQFVSVFAVFVLLFLCWLDVKCVVLCCINIFVTIVVLLTVFTVMNMSIYGYSHTLMWLFTLCFLSLVMYEFFRRIVRILFGLKHVSHL